MHKREFPNLLSPGFHHFAIDDLEPMFVTPFIASTRRVLLLRGLLDFIDDVTKLGIVGELWFDGSFVTQKTDPDDVDLVVVFDHAVMNSLDPYQQRKAIHLFHQPFAKAHYNCDVYCVPGDDMVMVSYWRGWFGFQRDGRSPKGIGWVTL